MATALTIKAIEALKPGPARREIPDGLVTGLYLIIQPSGVRSWAVRYRAGGKTRKHTLGAFPAVDLKAAREKARTAMLEVAMGTDPATAKQVAKAEG